MLKKIRLKRKLSQVQLAKKVGISQSYLSKLENITSRLNTINTSMVEKLSIELNVSPILLLIYFYFPYAKCNLKCHNCIYNQFRV